MNKIHQNLGEVDSGEAKRLFLAIKESNLLCEVAEGRSQSALKIGLRGIKKATLSQNDTGFRWRNYFDAAPFLEREYGRVGMVVNSGSGETDTPKGNVTDIKRCVQETGSKSFTVNSVTSHRDSSVGQKSDVIVQLKGREEEKEENADHKEVGLMGDTFELGALVFFLKLKEAINRGRGADHILSEVKTEMQIVGRLVDRYYDSDQYRSLVGNISTRHRTTIGGKGPGQEVATMTAIRLFHINQVLGGRVYLAGPLAPPPKPGDNLLLISHSGETPPVLEWCNKYKKAEARVFSIVGTKSSTLARESTSFYIKAPPDKFYARAAFILSPVPGGKIEIFQSAGIKIPEKMLEIFGHSVTQ
jgi:6-phospho-3-hexuloisomerase